MAPRLQITTRQMLESMAWFSLGMALVAGVLHWPLAKTQWLEHDVFAPILVLVAAGAAFGAGVGVLAKHRFQFATLGMIVWVLFLMAFGTRLGITYWLQ